MNNRARSRPIRTGEEDHMMSNDNTGHVISYEDHMVPNEHWHEDAAVSEEDTAGEGVDTPPLDSVTTDGYTDHLDPIDFIETHPRDCGRHQHPSLHLSHAQGYSHSFDRGLGVGRGVICEAQYEKWSMLMQMEDGSKKGKLAKRAKPPRVQKSERLRTPYQVPRLGKLGKPQHIHPRPSPLSRKRRLSVRLARPAQVSSVSEEGDMAQADEMGEGEGRDDGFVEGLDQVGRRRNKKRTGATHALLPPMGRTSPPSSPSNTPVSRRRASSRKSRPKPRCRKQGKPQLASADVSTQESTTQGPGSSDTSDATYPEDGGTSLRTGGEVVINSDEEEEEEEEEEEDGDEGRSVTPNLRSPSTSAHNHGAHIRDSADLAHGLRREAGAANTHTMQPANISSIIHSNQNDLSLDPHHHRHGHLPASSPVPHKDGRCWAVQRQESDLSTAPLSSETSDMDTSGNEKVLTTDSLVEVSSDVHCAQSPPLNRDRRDVRGVGVASKKGKSGSSGDEDPSRRSNVKKLILSKLIPEKPLPPHVATKKALLSQRNTIARLGPSLGPSVAPRKPVSRDQPLIPSRSTKPLAPLGGSHNGKGVQDHRIQSPSAATLSTRTLATASRSMSTKSLVGARSKPPITPKPTGLKPTTVPKKPHFKVGPAIGGGGGGGGWVEPVKPPLKLAANHRLSTGAGPIQSHVKRRNSDSGGVEPSARAVSAHGMRKAHNMPTTNLTQSLAQKPAKVLPKRPVKGTQAENGVPLREKGPKVAVRKVSTNPPLPPYKPSLPVKPRKISEKRYHTSKPQPTNLPSTTDGGVELEKREVILASTTSTCGIISAVSAPSLSNSSFKNLSSCEVTPSGQSQCPIAPSFSPSLVSKRDAQSEKTAISTPAVGPRRVSPVYATPSVSGGVRGGGEGRRGRQLGERVEKVGRSGREVEESGEVGEVEESGGEVRERAEKVDKSHREIEESGKEVSEVEESGGEVRERAEKVDKSHREIEESGKEVSEVEESGGEVREVEENGEVRERAEKVGRSGREIEESGKEVSEVEESGGEVRERAEKVDKSHREIEESRKEVSEVEESGGEVRERAEKVDKSHREIEESGKEVSEVEESGKEVREIKESGGEARERAEKVVKGGREIEESGREVGEVEESGGEVRERAEKVVKTGREIEESGGEVVGEVGESGREVGEVGESGGEVGESGAREGGGERGGNGVKVVSERRKGRSRSEEDGEEESVVKEVKDDLNIGRAMAAVEETRTVNGDSVNFQTSVQPSSPLPPRQRLSQEVTPTEGTDPTFSMSEVSLTESPSPSPLPSASDISTDQSKQHEPNRPKATSDYSSEEEATPPPIPPREYLMSAESIAALNIQVSEEQRPPLTRSLSKGPRRPPPNPPKTTPITDALPTSSVSTSVGGRWENNPVPSEAGAGAARKVVQASAGHYEFVDDIRPLSSRKGRYFDKHSARETVEAVNYVMVRRPSLVSQKSEGENNGDSPVGVELSKDPLAPPLPCRPGLRRSLTVDSSSVLKSWREDKEGTGKSGRVSNLSGRKQLSIRRPPPKPPVDGAPLAAAVPSAPLAGARRDHGDIYTFIDPADRDVQQPAVGHRSLGIKFAQQGTSITGEPPPLPSRPAPKIKSPISPEPCVRNSTQAAPLSCMQSAQGRGSGAFPFPPRLPSQGVEPREPIYDVIPESVVSVRKKVRREYEEVILPDLDGEVPRLWVPPEREKQLQEQEEQHKLQQQQQQQQPEQQQQQHQQQEQQQQQQHQQQQHEQQQQQKQQHQQQQVDECGESSEKSSPFMSKRNSSSSCGSGGGTPLMPAVHPSSREDTISSCSSGSSVPMISLVHPVKDQVGSRLAANKGNTNLDIADLRENWRAEEDAPDFIPNPVAWRKHSLSFSSHRDLMIKPRSRCPRSCSSDKLKVSTLGPSSSDMVLRRSCSLDRLVDGLMDDPPQNARCPEGEGSSSEDESRNAVVNSPGAGAYLDLPTVPNNDSPYRVPRSGSKPAGPYLVPPDMEPLYQYINTAEFLNETEEEEEAKEEEDKENQLNLARQLSLRRLWCELPEVIQSGVLNILTAEERKLQEAMFEVISSESTYLRSLDVLIQNFMDDPGMNPNLPEGRRVTDKRQHHVIFSNVKEVREVSAQFLSRLQCRQRESAVVKNISDIILDFAENKFDCYVRYCTNQVYQVREMQDIIETNLMFREYLRRLESHQVCQNLTMMSFLLLPMQRITRLPLLILAILNRTPLDHPDYDVVETTLRSVQTLVTGCNDGARKMDRTEQLHEIHKKLDFGKLKPFPIVSASRQLERRGMLVQLQVEHKVLGKNKIKKTPLHVFVLTDYIIISKKKKDARGDEVFRVKDYASRAVVEVEWLDPHHGVSFPKLGEQSSISRATVAVSEASAQHGILLLFLDNASGRREDYIFLAQNDTDRTRWIESMSRQDDGKSDTMETIYQHWDCPQVQAVYDYQAQQPDELGLERGDVVKVYRKMADGWYEGERLRDLECGWFPSNFTMEVENEHTRARNLRQTHKLNSTVDNARIIMQTKS